MRRDQTAADVGRVPANVGMHDGGSSGNESDNGVTRSTIEPWQQPHAFRTSHILPIYIPRSYHIPPLDAGVFLHLCSSPRPLKMHLQTSQSQLGNPIPEKTEPFVAPSPEQKFQRTTSYAVSIRKYSQLAWRSSCI